MMQMKFWKTNGPEGRATGPVADSWQSRKVPAQRGVHGPKTVKRGKLLAASFRMKRLQGCPKTADDCPIGAILPLAANFCRM